MFSGVGEWEDGKQMKEEENDDESRLLLSMMMMIIKACLCSRSQLITCPVNECL